MKIDVRNINAGTVARFVIILLALFNQAMVLIGQPVLPIDNEAIETFITLAFSGAAALIGYWKDNDITAYAIERKAAGEEAMTENDMGEDGVVENEEVQG